MKRLITMRDLVNPYGVGISVRLALLKRCGRCDGVTDVARLLSD